MQERASPPRAATDLDDEPSLTPENSAFVAFAGRLGHDLNNLLSTIIGSLGLLREDVSGNGDEQIRQLMDDALSASRECADLVDRLMAAAGKQMLHPQRVAANEVIERLIPLLKQTLPENIQLQVSLDPDLPPIQADPDRLEAAIIAAGGELIITADHGNCEVMWDETADSAHTAHTTNQVPCIWVSANSANNRLADGGLADLAPTLLALLSLEPSSSMTGTSLLRYE